MKRCGLAKPAAAAPSAFSRLLEGDGHLAADAGPVVVDLATGSSKIAANSLLILATLCILRRSLAAHGAPLVGEQPKVVFGLAETILRGLKAARNDATILRVLPVVIAKHAGELDWVDLAERARRMNLRAELGMLLDLTAVVADIPGLKARAEELRDARRKRMRYYPFVEGAFEKHLAAQRSPGAARRWHFLMNMTEDSFRETVRKHVPAEQVPAR